VPGLRQEDLARMPTVAALAAEGACVPLAPGFPAVTCPVQATLTTGTAPVTHGIMANGLYDRGRRHLEMWISPDSVHRAPRIWDRLKAARPDLRTAAWFLLQSKHASADLVCLPAPRHNADGTETMWCHTNPPDLYAALRESLGDFPLHRFWGPLAGIDSSRWIIDSSFGPPAKRRRTSRWSTCRTSTTLPSAPVPTARQRSPPVANSMPRSAASWRASPRSSPPSVRP
jgi:hypothetical protein